MDEDQPKGLLLAFTAYMIWGLLPLYMKELSHISALEIVAHRVIWSVPIAAVFLLWTRRYDDFKEVLKRRKSLLMAVMTAGLIAINWLTYIIAITSNQALEASLGYFLSPVFSIFLGATLLKERLSMQQWMAIGFALIAVLVLSYEMGKVPWIAVLLALSWCLYAMCKRALPIGAGQGFLLESLILTPFASAFIFWLLIENTAAFDQNALNAGLLIGCGFATALPLLIYASAAKLVRLSTIALMGYIIPSMIFVIAVFVFKEPFSMLKLCAFGLIWVGLALYTKELLRLRRKTPLPAR